MGDARDKTSDLGFALLGLLARSAATGYDLSARLARPIGFFWTARHSQVYPELSRLEDAQLVRHEEIEGRGPRPTKRYAITTAGRRALANWVATPVPSRGAKDPLVLRVYSLWAADPEAASRMLREERDRRVALLTEYHRHREIILDGRDEIPISATEFGNLAAVLAGIGNERHTIAWLDWLLESLASGAARPPAGD